jgi:D-alanine-D-alanine ligase
VKRLRILLLINKGLEPPATLEGLTSDQVLSAPWKTEYDVLAALQRSGHDVRLLSVYDDLAPVRQALDEHKPEITFNLIEEFGGRAAWDHYIVWYLEVQRQPYTGCNPRGLLLARDKGLSKELLSAHGVLSPRFAVFRRGDPPRRPRRLKFPLFVKGLREDASQGISQASMVWDDDGLAKRVAFVHEHLGDAIAEEFIEGREIYISILGNDRLEVLPLRELFFENKPPDAPLIATARAKWNLAYQRKWGVASREADDLPPPLARLLNRRARRIYKVLGLSGYGRLDFRLDRKGVPYFLEANPNPQLADGEDFAASALQRGLTYDRLIDRLLNLGLAWRPLI